MALITICIILVLLFAFSGFMQWRFAGIIQNDVEYMSDRMLNAPEDMPWPRMEGSYPYGIHEEIELHHKIMSVFSGVNHVSAFLLITLPARFANWMHNGQGTGSTETGAYDMTIPTPVRLAGATVFLPSENEWYKAAYHDPLGSTAGGPPGDDNYWLYPTQSDTAPAAEAPPGGTNSANLAGGDVTDVGATRERRAFTEPSTWEATCSNGMRRLLHPVFAVCAAGRGSATRTSCGPLSQASTFRRAISATASGFAWQVSLPPIPASIARRSSC